MVTKNELKESLRSLGVCKGMTLEVHSSLSSFGELEGGAETVIDTLKELVTEEGSIFMPALRLSRELPLSDEDKKLGITVKIKVLPPDSDRTAMGIVADTFRKLPDTYTGTDTISTSGWGKYGKEAVNSGLDYPIHNGGMALMLGVDIYKLTAMHYVEGITPSEINKQFEPTEEINSKYPPNEWFMEAGHPPVKAWYKIQDLAYEKGLIKETKIGECKIMFFDIWSVVSLYEDELRRDPYGLWGMTGHERKLMKTVDILGANRFEKYTKTRDGSRAVIIQDGKILLTHELNSGWWLLPGGGMEEGETPEDCVIREVEEETGVIVRPTEQFLTMHEYYEEYRYTGYFFVCEVTGKGRIRLTDVEKQRGVQPEWIALQDAVELFSKHESYADISEEKRGSYQREYIALKEYMDHEQGKPERQIYERFPGVSCAYRDAAGRETLKYDGFADKENGIPVEGSTVFPACSISKFITAITVMKLQEQELCNIDEAVNRYLHQWKLLTSEGKESDATIRSILDHTSGIIDGDDSFYGLRRNDPPVSLLDVLEGRTPYNKRPATSEKQAGTEFEYSDAGYCVLQLMIREIMQAGFEEVVIKYVFEPLGLKRTFFATLKNIELREKEQNMTAGYDSEGVLIPGKYPQIPDLAASGLWSTPYELMMIAKEFILAVNGRSSFLRKESAREMIRPTEKFSRVGLGLFLRGDDTLVSQGWGENGQSMLKMNFVTGEISAVMTNMDPGVDQTESGVEQLTAL